MPVPLEVERFEAEPNRAAASLTRRIVRRVAADRFDLSVTVPGALFGVELVCRRGTTGEAVMAGQLFEHARGGAVRPTVHRFDEREERDALERRSVLAARPDHLDRGEGARRGIGLISLFTRDARFVEHLQHDVDMRLLPAELLHEVLHHDVHERVVPLARDVRDDIAEEDRIRADAKVMLDLAEDDLLPRPTVLHDSFEPRVVRHEELPRDAPELLDEPLVRHEPNVPAIAMRRSVSTDTE